MNVFLGATVVGSGMLGNVVVVVASVVGSVEGSVDDSVVDGSVEGSVEGSVDGSVLGSVEGSVVDGSVLEVDGSVELVEGSVVELDGPMVGSVLFDVVQFSHLIKSKYDTISINSITCLYTASSFGLFAYTENEFG